MSFNVRVYEILISDRKDCRSVEKADLDRVLLSSPHI